MTVRPLAYLLMTALPLVGSSVDHRLGILERQVSELQSLVHSLHPRAPQEVLMPQAPEEAENSHVVRAGESYWSIARRHGISVNDLENANPGTDPRRLSIGATIRIPGQKTNRTPSHQASIGSATYTVRSGDILGRISEAHGIRLHQLLSANPNVNPRRLKIGTVLTIPGQENPDPIEEPSPQPPTQQEEQPVEPPQVVETYQPAPPPTEPASVDIPKTILVTVDKNMRLLEVANRHATSVAILNRLNEVNLSPEQMIKIGSQLYVPGN